MTQHTLLSATAPDLPRWRGWLAIVFLGIGAFTIVTIELAPIGLLSAIARDMGRTLGVAGIAAMLVMWVAAISAIYAAIGTGAMVGAWVLSSSGFSTVMVVAGLGGVVSILVVASIGRPVRALQPGLSQ